MNKKDGSQKIAKILIALFGGLAQKLSIRLVLNAKKQVDDTIFKIKKSVLVGFFTLFGCLFLLIGSGIYLNNLWDHAPGVGFLAVGGVSVFIAIIIALIKK